ncbi:DUF308 domain-containing protein [Streptococcus oricebi]|uniref:DUF308 domain-containing protein n=1 Tax=Streptococcus oricebi TaxID=1547447 RepID=UPI001FD9BE3F|nr:DUF308 domain-containing protein [Streptococcus oricebi]
MAYGYLSLPILIPTILAVALIVSSIGGIIRANRLKPWAPKMSDLLLGLSIIGLLLGLVLLFNPMIASIFVSYIIALGFVYNGVTYLLHALTRLEE